MKIFILLFTLFVTLSILGSGIASAVEEGFIYKWSYELEKEASSIAAADFDRDRIPSDVLVGSWDNNIYAFDTNGSLLGYHITKSSVTSVSAFSHDGDNRMNDGVAGSLDNKVYAFWRPYGRYYFYTDPDKPDTPKGLWWSYDAGDNIYSVASVDLNGTGQKDSIIVGTGSYYSTSPGKIIALNRTGSVLWSKSTSSSVNVITSADLDSDTKVTHVVAGYGNTLDILDSNGKTIWTHGFSAKVMAASPADFDKNEELDDVIVGAGNVVYALDSRNNILWTHEFNATVVSIHPIDSDRDMVYDYYLIASGSAVYAVKNDIEHPVLWKYDTGHNITKLVSLDLEKDGIPNDIVFVSGNQVYAYTHAVLKQPDITAEKALSNRMVNIGEEFGIDLVINNTGDANASDIRVSDSMPDNFTLVSGNLSWTVDSLSPGEAFRQSYIIRAEVAGNYTLPEATGEYQDPYSYSVTRLFKSSSIPVNVSTDMPAHVVEVKLAQPKIVFVSSKSGKVKEGKNFTVNFTITNEGGSGTNVTLKASFPEDFVLAENRTIWQGYVDANESEIIRYTLNPSRKVLRLRSEQYNLSNFNVTYTVQKETVHLSPDQIELTVEVSLKKRILSLLAGLMFMAAVFFAMSRTRKATKVKGGGKIEKGILKLYLEHKKMGKKLTYSTIKKTLKADKGEIQRAVARLKAEGKM